MFDFIAKNIGTVAIGLIVAGVIAAIIAKIVKDKRKGKCVGCDCCSNDCCGRSSVGIK